MLCDYPQLLSGWIFYYSIPLEKLQHYSRIHFGGIFFYFLLQIWMLQFPKLSWCDRWKHIHIVKPVASGSSFYNDKQYFSFFLFPVANANYRFTYFNIGSYGSSSNLRIFFHSTFGQMLQNNELSHQMFHYKEQGAWIFHTFLLLMRLLPLVNIY